MITVITSGEYSDFSIDGIFELPEGFDVKAEFAKWADAEGLTYSECDDDSRVELYKRLTGTDRYFPRREEFVAPWLMSLGFKEVEYKSVDPSSRY